jgi:hypothetical protein
MTRLRLGIVALATLALATGCSTGKAGPSNAAPPRPPQTAEPASPTPDDAGTEAEDILILRRLEPDASATYSMLFGRNGEQLFSLPDGAASRGFLSIVRATPDGDRTAVELVSGEGGGAKAEATVDGAWRLPTVGLGRRPAGISADASTIVLEEARASTAARRTTRFATVILGDPIKTRTIELDGDFSFDALSPDGAWLYLIEHRAAGTYRVRRVDVSTGKLDDAPVVDKRDPGDVMFGYAVTQLPGPDGWVYTLYVGQDRPFIHALDTIDGVAFCIDLPAGDAAATTDATLASWALALEPQGRTLFAANGSLGTVSQISLDDFTVTRIGLLPKQVGAVTLAKFEHGDWSNAGSAAISPDGDTLYVATSQGVTAISAADLTALGALGGDRTYRNLVVGASGKVYGVDRAGALYRLGTIDAPSDTRLGNDSYAAIEGLLSVR